MIKDSSWNNYLIIKIHGGLKVLVWYMEASVSLGNHIRAHNCEMRKIDIKKTITS